jgi:hypothetical protein
LFAIVALDEGRGREKSLLEFHRRYIGGKRGSGVFCRNGPQGASHKRLPPPFSTQTN